MAGKKGSKKQATARVRRLALESMTDALDCRTCVIRTIESQSGSTVGGLGDKMSDLFSPCDTGAMADLADALRERCDAPSDLRVRCSSTVMQVINGVCS